MSAAVPDSPPSKILQVLDDPRWQVYPGVQPAGVTREAVPLWVSVFPGPPDTIGVGLASESWGQIREVWQLQMFGTTIDEARNLRNWVLSTDWGPTWELIEYTLTQVTEQTYADPSLWMSSCMVRDIAAWC